MAAYTYAPTVEPNSDFEAWTDAQVLREAMKGLGTDEDAIIDLLTHRSINQRLEIAEIYKTQFGRDLIDDLKSELRGNFEDVIVALLTPTIDFLAKNLHKAMSGAGTNEKTLIEIMYTVSPIEMDDLKSAYKKLYGKSLEDAVKSETGGHFRKLLISLTTGRRDFLCDVDDDMAADDAKNLMDAGEGQWGTEESVFLSILATQSFPQLRKTFDEYLNLTSRTIEHAIESELSGDIKMGLLFIVKCARNMPAFFAERLYESMKGFGTDDSTLIRIVVTRSEMDMKLIKAEFETAYGKPLQHYIAGDTSGDYKKILLSLVRD